LNTQNSLKQLFINDAVVAVDKPGGYLSVPSRMGAQDPRPCLGRELEKSLGVRLWPVHRLDEEVTGVIVFARTASAHRDLSRAFEERSVTKTYEAFTDAKSLMFHPAFNEDFLWECLMLRGKKRAYESPHGKRASTKAKVTAEVNLGDGAAFHWMLSPLTGRGHQLRYELYRHGFPIIGDHLYGSTRSFGKDMIALRCASLGFTQIPQVAKALGLPEEIVATPLRSLVTPA
jgi:tRNA pseudouridine32 synthase/23S rRNA pseudouridine746 synthase